MMATARTRLSSFWATSGMFRWASVAGPMISTSTPTGSPAAISGRWVSDREFVLDLDTIAEVNHFVFRLTFDRDELGIIVDEVTGELKGLPIRAHRSASGR